MTLNKNINNKNKISYRDVDHEKIRLLLPGIKHTFNNPLCMCDVCRQSRYPDVIWINREDINYSEVDEETIKRNQTKKLNDIYNEAVKH